MKKLLIACAITGLFSPVVFAHGPEGGYPMGPWMMGWGHGMGWIFPLLIIAVISVCILVLSRRGGRGSW
jgi:hypothetical protein